MRYLYSILGLIPIFICGCQTSTTIEKKVLNSSIEMSVRLSVEDLKKYFNEQIPKEILSNDLLVEVEIKSDLYLTKATQLFYQQDRFFLWSQKKCYPIFPHLGNLTIKHCDFIQFKPKHEPAIYLICENKLQHDLLIIIFKAKKQWNYLLICHPNGDVQLNVKDHLPQRVVLIEKESCSQENGILVFEENNSLSPLTVSWLTTSEVNAEISYMPLFDFAEISARRGRLDSQRLDIRSLVQEMLLGKKCIELDHLNRLDPAPIFILYPQCLKNLHEQDSGIKDIYGWAFSKDIHETKYDIENHFYRVERKQKQKLQDHFPRGVDFFYLYDYR